MIAPMQKIVQIRCEGKMTCSLGNLLDFQGELKHLPEENYQMLRNEIEHKGFRFPVNVWVDPQGVNHIIDGHQRVRTLERMRDREGWEVPELPISLTFADTEQEAKDAVLAATSQYGVMTDTGLAGFVSKSGLDLSRVEKSFVLPSIDFKVVRQTLVQGAGGLAGGDTAAPDEPPPVPATPFVQRGDVFHLGAHRIICGDSTDKATVTRLVGPREADLVFTDPPYGVAYTGGPMGDRAAIANDALDAGSLLSFLLKAFEAWPLKAGGGFYVCSPAGCMEGVFRQALGSWIRQCIVWVKHQFVFGRQDYHWRHESILYGWKEGAGHYFVDDRTQDTVWEFPRPHRSELHPTMKPLELVEKAVNNSSRVGELVFDGFLGSGTTLIAAERTGRVCFGVEHEPGYCHVILERWTQLTGKDPIRDSDGALWSEIKSAGAPALPSAS